MPSKKQEIRKQVKKKLKKEGMEHQELNQEAEIVDLGDHRGDDIIVESFDDIKTDAKPLPFSTTPQKEKKGITGRIKSIFSQDSSILRKLEKQADEIIAIEPQAQAMSDEELCAQTQFFKLFAKWSADIYIEAVFFLPPLIINGVRDSSIKIESTSSTNA